METIDLTGLAQPRRFAQPTGGELYVSMPLTNIAIAYMQDNAEFVADRIFPNVPVQTQGGSYYKYDRANWNRAEAKVRAPATESVGGGWEVSQDTYRAEVYAFHKDIADQDRANQMAPFDLERDATRFVSRQLLLTREVIFAQKFFASSIWGTDLTGVPGSPTGGQFKQWNDAASDPVALIRAQATAMAGATGFRPNKLVIGPHVRDALMLNASIRELIKYQGGSPAMADENTLAQLFGLDQVLVCNAIQNTANEGAAESNAFIFGKAALLLYAPARPSLMEPSAGYTFTWNGYLPGTDLGVSIERFRMQNIKSDRVEGEMAFDMEVVAADLGVFMASAVA